MTQQQYDDDRFRKDIEEALQRAGADHLPPEPPSRRFRLAFDPRPSGPGPIILAGVVLIILWRLRILGGFTPLAATLGLALLVFGLATWLIRPRRKTVFWREREIEVGEPTWLEQFYYWCYKA